MEKFKFQAKKEEGLLEKALNELNLKEEDVLTRLFEEKSGLFSGKRYILEVVKLSDVAELGKDVLNELLFGLNIQANVETKIRNGKINYQIYSQNNSVIIGKNGHILESIQLYVRQAIFNAIEMYVNVLIDVEGYKEKQNYFLEKNVKKIARDVTLSKGEVKLDPMNSYERKLVHDALQGFKYITSNSVGEEPNRCIVIKYCENKEEEVKEEE